MNTNHIRILLVPLLCCLLTYNAQARFSDGFIVGGFAGLTTALVAGAVARQCSTPCPVYCAPARYAPVYQETVYVTPRVERVVYKPCEPAIVYKECPTYVVEKKACNQCPAHNGTQVQAALRQQKRQTRKNARDIQRLKNEQADALVKGAEQKSLQRKEEQERILALREKEAEIALIKEKRELLEAENKKRELKLKERSLEDTKKS